MTPMITFFLSPLISLFVAPAVMLFIGKKLNVVSNNLNYKRLLLITFIGLLLGGLVEELFPYAVIIATIACLLWPIKKQLNTNWTQALVITFSGLAVIIAVNYLPLLFLI